MECIPSNASYAVANSDGGQTIAKTKSSITNTLHVIPDSNRGENAISESFIDNTRHLPGSIHKGNFVGDYYIISVFIRIRIVFRTTKSNL